MAVVNQYLPSNRHGLAACKHAEKVFSLVDADVNTNSGAVGGIAGLVAIIADSNHTGKAAGQYAYLSKQVQNVFTALGRIGWITDSLVNGVTTLAGLEALFTANDGNLPAGYDQTFVIYGV